jgi:hypothetical protein
MNLKGKQIQTLFQTLVQTYFLNLKKAKRVMWAVSYLPTPCSGPTQAACRPTRPRHRPLFLFLSPTGGPRLAVTVFPHLLSLSILHCLTLAPVNRATPKRAAGPAMPVRGTGCGRTARPARTPRAGARPRDWVRPRRKGEGRICPARGHPRRSGLRPWRATCPARRRCQGH